MKITNFKEGDIITRLGRAKEMANPISMFSYGTSEKRRGDGSYIGNKIELVGVDDSNIMVIVNPDTDPSMSNLGRDEWDDDNWGYFPHPLFKRAQERIGQLMKNFIKTKNK